MSIISSCLINSSGVNYDSNRYMKANAHILKTVISRQKPKFAFRDNIIYSALAPLESSPF